MKKVVRGILIGFGVLLIAGIISSCYLNNEEKHWDNVREQSKKRKANKESTGNNSSSNKSGRTLSVRLGNNKLITALDNDFMQLYDVYSMDDPAIYQRYIDTNSNSSFRVLKGSTVVENEISGYNNVKGYGVCESGKNDPYMAVVSIKASLADYGYADTTTLLNDFMSEIMPFYLNLFEIDTSSIDLYNGEKYIFGNSHAAIINGDATKTFAVIGDANDSVTMIFIRDSKVIDIMDVVANFEPFESDGHKFIKDPDRDLVYMDNIKDIF